MKIVYLWKNGNPVIVEQNNEGEYIYPNENYTTERPPEGIFQPFYYDGVKWVGQKKEDWEQTIQPTVVEPNSQDILISSLLDKVLAQDSEIQALKIDLANVTNMMLQSQGGTNDVSNT